MLPPVSREVLLQRRVVRDHVLQLLGHRPEHTTEQRQADRPGQDGAALQPPGQTQRRGEQPCGAGRSGPVRQHAGAHVASRRSASRPARAVRRRRAATAAAATSGPRRGCAALLRPADRRQPGQEAVLDVADRAQREGGAEDGERGAESRCGRATSAGRRRSRRPRRRCRAAPPTRRTGARDRCGKPSARTEPVTPAPTSTEAETADEDGSGGPSVPAHDGGGEQLGATDLLLGAGVPDHGERRHQRDDRAAR